MCLGVYASVRVLDKVMVLWLLISLFGLIVSGVVVAYTDPNDVAILRDFGNRLENAHLLNWPSLKDNDPCGSKWPHVYCSGDRVVQIQVQDMGLKGSLPPGFNRLSKLTNLGMQRNKFNGSLPTLSGLSYLKYVYLNDNEFDVIPSDFFHGLSSLQVLALDNNPLNRSVGWRIPDEIQGCQELMNLSLIKCNLVGELPEFLGGFGSLRELKLSSNRFVGGIPKSFGKSNMQVLWLDGQEGGLSGSIEVIAMMTYLMQLRLHNNHFTGTIPDISSLTSLKELNLNGNEFVGVIPPSMGCLDLVKLNVANNKLMGPIPKFNHTNATYDNNLFCQSVPGSPCSADVTALLAFLAAVNYPSNLVSQWSGNDPCSQQWVGINCNSQSKIIRIVLPNRKLNGTLSPSVSSLESLLEIKLGGNNLSGLIPGSLTGLKSLTLLDLTDNNFEPPVPEFGPDVTVILDGNPQFSDAIVSSEPTPPPLPSPEAITPSNGKNYLVLPQPAPLMAPSFAESLIRSLPTPPKEAPVTSHQYVRSNPPTFSVVARNDVQKTKSYRSRLIIIGAVVAGGFLLFILVLVVLSNSKSKKSKTEVGILVRPKNPSDHQKAASSATGSSNDSLNRSGDSSGLFYSYPLEFKNVISVQILQKVTNNFAPENELGRGGFGVVYKGVFNNGTCVAVKRMEAGVFCKKAIDEFQSEINVLSKVRHRHLVSLLGYSIEGNERLLVYEYMPQGSLSKHLFHWESLKLKPLSWATRLGIALDVARGVEYLHGLACESFIHRDLKSCNILLGENFRAKVSDFGLVKLAPDFGQSIATRVAGTFGYLAPEYAVMGKITTKSDVFSFGVVLVELLTGLKAVDEGRPEESRYLAQWFRQIKSNKKKLMEAIDKTLDLQTDDSILENISIFAELAGNCTERDPSHRPDMSYVVNVLAPLVEKWQPVKHDETDFDGVNLNVPLSEMLKGWQENANESMSLSTSEESLPSGPVGFPDLNTINCR